jgi:hypothetical protein
MAGFIFLLRIAASLLMQWLSISKTEMQFLLA